MVFNITYKTRVASYTSTDFEYVKAESASSALDKFMGNTNNRFKEVVSITRVYDNNPFAK